MDGQGRVTEINDDNGLAERTQFDEWGSVAAEFTTDALGTERKLRDYLYNRTTAPYHTRTRTYSDTGAVQASSVEVEDGLGRVGQKWTQTATGQYLYDNSLADIRGLVSRTSHPVLDGFVYNPRAMTIASGRTRMYYDAIGRQRETIDDEASGMSSSVVRFDQPRIELREDEAGYSTRITYDAHHRVIKVEEGNDNAGWTTTARYRYDAKHRLVSFTDARSNIYAYFYDGAGRLRQVKRGVTYGTLANWYTYEYTGSWRTRLDDNAGGYAEWEYDDIGRPIHLVMSDGLPLGTGKLTYEWTYDTEWIGAVSIMEDPTGTTTYHYDELGRVDEKDRAYTSGIAPQFGYDFDLQGREIERTLPSGQILRNTYNYGWRTRQTALTGMATDYTVDYQYNTWGKLSQATSSLGHTLTRTYTTPLHVDRVRLVAGATTRTRDYTFLDNGLLYTRQEDGGPGRIFTYSYDELRQLTLVMNGATTVESFSYDAAGNPTSVRTPGGATWTYAGAGLNNIVASRTNGVDTDTFGYDAAGRTTLWQTNTVDRRYYYDGLGRLRGVKTAGVWSEVIDYDANGQAVRRAFGDPYAGSPPTTYSFLEWDYESAAGITTESHSDFVSERAGVRSWLFKEYDGHVAISTTDAGVVTSTRRLSAYGLTSLSSGTPYSREVFHGARAETNVDLFHLGQRHLARRDGGWLQPEPLLYEGIPQDRLTDPHSLSIYRYSGNRPTLYADKDGRAAAPISAAKNAPSGSVTGLGLDCVQLGLGVLGMVPGFGEVADVADGVISLARGDLVGAGLSAASCLPTGGQVAGAAKVARMADRIGGAVGAIRSGSKVTETAQAAKKGGTYTDVRKANSGGEVHHTPANSISPLSHGDGPSVWMETADHQKTASWGRSQAAQDYRATQSDLIKQGRFDDAVQMDIDDIRGKFGDKYDEGILQMIDSLPSNP